MTIHIISTLLDITYKNITFIEGPMDENFKDKNKQLKRISLQTGKENNSRRFQN